MLVAKPDLPMEFGDLTIGGKIVNEQIAVLAIKHGAVKRDNAGRFAITEKGKSQLESYRFAMESLPRVK